MIKQISVLGAGTMGVSIALSFARFGYSVNIYDPNEQARLAVHGRAERELKKMIEYGLCGTYQVKPSVDNIHVFDDLQSAVAKADLVVESVVEVLSVKQVLFAQLADLCRKECIFTTNSSSLSLTDITANLSDEGKKRCMVTHFFNPGHIVPLVELSNFDTTDEAIYPKVAAIFEHIDKKPVKINKDVNGLVGNRIQVAVLREALTLVDQGVISLADIDKVIKYGLGFRYAAAGCIEISDMGGLDIWNAVCNNLLPVIDNSQSTNSVLTEKLTSGDLGLKTGKGFYDYRDTDANTVSEDFQQRLLQQLSLYHKNKLN